MNGRSACGLRTDMYRRLLLSAALLPVACSTTAPFDPTEATLADVRAAIDGGLRCRDLAAAYEAHYRGHEPDLNAYVTWNSRLLDEAAGLDEVPANERGRFHCVPLAVKDNVDVAGMPTTNGMAALRDSTPPDDAEVVARLRRKGVLILGKTNMPDFASGFETNSSVSGQTYNPYDLRKTPYGSSGGTAAAIAASMGVLGIGTDTLGSLVLPSSANGLVTVRATQGLVPSDGVVPATARQDVVGPMTRTVNATAEMLTLMADGPEAKDYRTSLVADGLEGLRVGVWRLLLREATPADAGVLNRPDPDVAARFEPSVQAIRDAGATLVHLEDTPAGLLAGIAALTAERQNCIGFDLRENLEAYLASLGPEAPYRSVAALLTNDSIDPSIKAQAEALPAEVTAAQACAPFDQARDDFRALLVQLMDAQSIDLLVYPAVSGPPSDAGQPIPDGWLSSEGLSSFAGLPSLAMPMGLTERTQLPVGLVFLARAYREDLLVQAGYGLEQAILLRRPPRWPHPSSREVSRPPDQPVGHRKLTGHRIGLCRLRSSASSWTAAADHAPLPGGTAGVHRFAASLSLSDSRSVHRVRIE